MLERCLDRCLPSWWEAKTAVGRVSEWGPSNRPRVHLHLHSPLPLVRSDPLAELQLLWKIPGQAAALVEGLRLLSLASDDGWMDSAGCTGEEGVSEAAWAKDALSTRCRFIGSYEKGPGVGWSRAQPLSASLLIASACVHLYSFRQNRVCQTVAHNQKSPWDVRLRAAVSLDLWLWYRYKQLSWIQCRLPFHCPRAAGPGTEGDCALNWTVC